MKKFGWALHTPGFGFPPVNVERAMLPYGMAKNDDGSWTLFNCNYKTLGTIGEAWSEWDDPRYKIRLEGLDPSKLAHDRMGKDDRIYFYDDGCHPDHSAAHRRTYLRKLRILVRLQGKA